MAPVELDPQPSLLPLALAASHASAVVILSSIIGLGLYRSHQGLGPAQDTRQRISQRRKLTTAFGSLAGLSLVLAVGSAISYLSLSYNVWASERGIEAPNYIFGNSAHNGNDTGLFLTKWLSDTPIYLDAQEIVAEAPRRLWWGGHVDLAVVPWTMLLSIEGRRRQIPFLWAYALLAQLVSLSFAQNLFYIALLLTPSPIATQSRVARLFNRAFPPKPANWLLKPSIYVAILVLSYAAVFALPVAAGTSWFPYAAWLTRSFAFWPLVVPALVPESWGTVGSDPHDSYGDISKLFRLMSIASTLLHAKATVSSFLYDLPGAYKHRHSIKIPFDTEKRSAWERSATAFERILGAMTDHPVVAAAGKDALLSALSLGLWAAVRAMDVGDILVSAIPYTATKPTGDAPVEETDTLEESPKAESMTLRRRHKPRYPSISSNGLSDEGTPTPAPRKRGRPRKVITEVEPDPEEVPGDTTYEPTAAEKASIGDVVPGDDFDWESAALTWGLTALGGLGAGSAGVFGAECISR